MRLTDILYRFKPKLPGGSLWHGKHRLYLKVRPTHAADLRNKYALEDRNLFYLRHPYLTHEESDGHGVALGNPKKRIDKLRDLKVKHWKEHSYLGDRIGFLKVAENWE